MPKLILTILKNYPNELGRKILHIATVFFCLGLIQIFNPGGVAFIISVVTLAIFLVDTLGFLDFFKNVRRISFGHYFMAFGIVVTLVLYSIFKNYSGLVFAFLVLGLCDPLAVFGRPIYTYLTKKPQFSWLKKLIYQGKTITGSLIFFGSALVLGLIVLLQSQGNITTSKSLKLLICVAMLTAIEFWSIWGIDNLTLPVGSIVLYQWLIEP